MQRIKLYIPLLLFIVLALVFFAVEKRIQSGDYDPKSLPSALIGMPLPTFNLPTLEGGHLSIDDLPDGPVLLNVWATWCPTCHFEHPYLLELAQRGVVAMYGINYKDDAAAAKEWLQQRGNPFIANVIDSEGRMGLDLGVTGAPETYLLDSQGRVQLRFQGELNEQVWQEQFAPLLERWGS